MTNTLARVKKAGKNFEIIVDLGSALKFKKGNSDYLELEIDRIFRDSKKGEVASALELETAFGTQDALEIAKRIVKEGEVQVTQEYRDEARDKKEKQVVDFLVRNAVDPQSGRPHTSERIKNALEQSGISIKNTPIESQIHDIVTAISPLIPIKISVKKIKIIVPAVHTGKVYGLLSQYPKEENWRNDGSLEAVLSIPAGIVIDFYEKLNSSTHGSALTEEVKE